MNDKISIMGIPVDNITMEGALRKVGEYFESDKFNYIFTPNSEMLQAAHKDEKLKEVLLSSHMLIPDGAGVILASAILGNKLKEKVSGIDLVKKILENARETNISLFILGGKPDVARKACEKIKKDYAGVKIAGHMDGYFKPDDVPNIITIINNSGANLLLVCLGVPRQEFFIYENRDRLRVKVAIGAGGTVDVLSGETKDTPEFMRRSGFEWLYRLAKQPKRFLRMLNIPVFLGRAFFTRIKGTVK